MKKIVVNGKVLLGGVSGIERTSWEILRYWDTIVDQYGDVNVEILVPKGFNARLSGFQNIKIVEFGNIRNLTVWQQIFLPLYIMKSKGIFVSFANNAPLLIRKGIVLLHDISSAINKDFYSRKTRIKFILETNHVTNGSFKLATVSHFSAKEIARVFHYPEDKILVLGNGWEHMQRIKSDDKIFFKYKNLLQGKYYFSLSSLAPNKNFEWIMDTARLNPNETFAIAGGFKKSIYGESNYNIPFNVMMLGRVSDEEAKALLSNSKAFLFPTLYEGFGIPPLEAYSCGTVSIVSDSEVMHEVYGDSVAYINSQKPCSNISSIVLPSWDVNNCLLKKHSWARYGKTFFEFVLENLE